MRDGFCVDAEKRSESMRLQVAAAASAASARSERSPCERTGAPLAAGVAPNKPGSASMAKVYVEWPSEHATGSPPSQASHSSASAQVAVQHLPSVSHAVVRSAGAALPGPKAATLTPLSPVPGSSRAEGSPAIPTPATPTPPTLNPMMPKPTRATARAAANDTKAETASTQLTAVMRAGDMLAMIFDTRRSSQDQVRRL